jgi:hypothetical protein
MEDLVEEPVLLEEVVAASTPETAQQMAVTVEPARTQPELFLEEPDKEQQQEVLEMLHQQQCTLVEAVEPLALWIEQPELVEQPEVGPALQQEQELTAPLTQVVEQVEVLTTREQILLVEVV